MAADRPQHTDRAKEVKSVEGEQSHLQQASRQGNDVQALSGKELKTSYENWQNQFASLPQKDGKLDTAHFTEANWKQVDTMYKELNKPGGAIEQAQATVGHLTERTRVAGTDLHVSDQHPQRSKA